ncbi:MAG TPA: radical SAM protein [Candidatus Binataceae bacterium]|nr:radical SAM protein [Candidatus Binataceae bacterium]
MARMREPLPQSAREALAEKGPGARPRPRAFETLRLVLSSGGPGRTEFALNNACNANCGFCSFARDALPKERWEYVARQGAFDAIDILYRRNIRYLILTGGEPTLHPDLTDIIAHAADQRMKVMMVSNAGLLKPRRLQEYAEAGLSSFVISIDAANAEKHEENRGLPGVCEKIREANEELNSLGMIATASVTLSRLVDLDALPDFLAGLGFKAVTFSYPLTKLNSSFLGYRQSGLVDFTREELVALYDKVKTVKSRMHVVNPTRSLEEMQRFVRGEPQHFPCLGGYRYFYLDWKLKLWRCHYWEEPLCSIYDFDDTKLVRDGCTRCSIDCYRDASTMQHIAVSAHDAAQALKRGDLAGTADALGRKGNGGSIHAVLEQIPWLLKF